MKQTIEEEVIRCSLAFRLFSGILGVGCFFGGLLVAGVLLLALMNMRSENSTHIFLGFLGATSVVFSFVASVKLCFSPSQKCLLWFLGAAMGFGIFVYSFSLPGAKGLMH